MAERTKRCPLCDHDKPWSAFSPRSYWPDGSVRSVQAYCREHNALRCRERRAKGPVEDPVKKRARQLRWVHNLPPERRAIIRDQQREWWRHKYGVTPERHRKRETFATGRSPRVDAGPFRDWLLSNVQSFSDRRAMADALGIGYDRMNKVISGELERVEFDTVDKALTNYGPLTVDDLYSEAA